MKGIIKGSFGGAVLDEIRQLDCNESFDEWSFQLISIMLVGFLTPFFILLTPLVLLLHALTYPFYWVCNYWKMKRRTPNG